ncbi:MAG: NfeD family protein [Clostridiaceae bacterium]|nr:NfeD family protein [Clostridiaceae bacterium]
MLELLGQHAIAVWLVLLVVFVVFEAATVQLVSVWFALGALAALIAAICHAPAWLQIVLFILISAVSFAVTRPLVKKFSTSKIQKTNADRCIGDTAIVTEEINNLEAKGQVKVDGNIWTARSENNDIIPAGEKVTVMKIEGVKLIVKKED